MSLRFHLDENVDTDIADGLRAQGIDVTTSQESRLLSATDDVQFEYAGNERRVLITHDRDFLIITSKHFEHWGIAYCASGSQSIGEIIAECTSLSDRLNPEEMFGIVEYI